MSNSNLYDIEGAFFRFCDPDTNLLKLESLEAACRGVNISLEGDLLGYLLEATGLDIETSSPLTIEEFEEVVEVAMTNFDEAQHYQTIFNLLDRDNKGYLNYQDLAHIRDQLQPNQEDKEQATDQELLDMLLIAQTGPYSKQSNNNPSPALLSLNWPTITTNLDQTSNLKVSLKQFCRLMDNINNGSHRP